MAFSDPRDWTTGEVVTAAIMNAHVRDNFDQTAPAKMTAAGDMLYATGANAPARLAKGTNGNILHQASCAPAWTASPSITGITLSGTLDVNGTADFDVTDFDVASSGDIDLTSTSNAACAIYIRANAGTSETIKIHADQGTSVTEGGASVSLLSDAGGVELRSTANLANAINITSDGGTTGSKTIYKDQGSSETEGAASIELLSDAGGVELRSTANLANAVALTSDGGTTGSILIYNDQGTTATEGSSSIQLLSDVGAVGIKSGLNAAGAIRLTADAGTSETIILHADQGSGVGSICLTSDAGGITLNPATFVTVGGNATNAGEIRILEDTDHGCNYVAIKSGNVTTSYTLTLPTAVAGGNCYVLKSTNAGVLSWAAASGGCVACDSSPQLGGNLDVVTHSIVSACNRDINIVPNGTGSIGLNTTGVSAHRVEIGGSFTGTSDGSAGFSVNPSITGAACGSTYVARIKGTIIEAGSGTHPIALGLAVETPTITNGAAATTTASTLWVQGAPSGATTNYAVYVDGGTSRFDGPIVAAAGTYCAPAYSFCGDTNTGMYRYGACDLALSSGGSEKAFILTGSQIYMADCINSKHDTYGLTINQVCKDLAILSFKSSDVAHGLTADSETDTFGFFKKSSAGDGGLHIHGLSEATNGIRLAARVETEGTTKSASISCSSIHFCISKHDGANGDTTFATDANLFSIRKNDGSGATRFIFDVEGTFHADVGSTTYDDYCDVEVLRGVLAETVPCYKENYQERFGKDLMYNLCFYEENKLIGKDSIWWEKRPCGRMQQRAMINFTGLTMLHHSTIIQLADRVDARLTALENQIALQGGK